MHKNPHIITQAVAWLTVDGDSQYRIHDINNLNNSIDIASVASTAVSEKTDPVMNDTVAKIFNGYWFWMHY